MSAAFFAVGCGPDSPEGTVLKGNISGTNAIAVTRVDDLNRKAITIVGRINVAADGSFSESLDRFEPNLYELNFPNGKKMQFVVESAESLEFRGDASRPETIRVKGAPENEKFLKYEEFRKESLERLVKSVRKQIEEFPDKSSLEYERLGRLEVTNYNKHRLELLDFAKKNLRNSIALYPTLTRWPYDAEAIEPIVREFENAHPEWKVTAVVKKKLATVKQTSIGGTVPNIKMRDENGTVMSLYDVKGKLTLVDFWGSWCGPCRREANTLSELYAKYKPKGFEIYGVGLEKELELWKNAKAIDKRVWPNVVSLRELDTDAAYDYGITALPANFLIDENGKIIARDIHDEELVAKVAEILGE